MKVKILFICLLSFAVIFTFNSVCAENFTDLNQEIDNNDFIDLNQDIVLNQNTSNEEEIFSQGISIDNRQILVEGNNHTICAKDSCGNQVKLFNIINSNVTLSNIIITSANFNGTGGVISIDKYSNLTLRNVTFKDNSAGGIYGEGGVVYSYGTLHIYDSIFENNYASGAGGAIYSTTSNCFVHNSKFINNTAVWYGGAIYSNGILEVTDSLLDINKAYSGAALHLTVSQDSWNFDEYAFLFNSTFTNNVADFGAVISSSSIKYIFTVNCNFIKNHAYKGGVLYKNGVSKSFIDNSLIENNSAEIGAVFYDASFEMGFYDDYSDRTLFSVINASNTIFRNNFASDKASVFYGKSSNFWVNQSLFYNNSNYVIGNGRGNITVLNSIISNYESDFVTQFLGGNLILQNNTWGVNNPDFDFNKTNIDLKLDIFKINDSNIVNVQNTSNLAEFGCCSVYLRLNQNDYVISHRRDSRTLNTTVYIDKDQDFIREYKAILSYFFLSKVYTNGWVIGSGGWENAGENEKIEAIASDMVKNENINQEALDLILKTSYISSVGHLLIVAPNGTYGNVITHSGNDIVKMGVLGDGDYIISPNGPDYRREGHLDNITDVVDANIYLSANDWYGVSRHNIVVHHINLNENGFADSVYVSNDDGRFVNRSDGGICDEYWFKEELTQDNEVPLILDKKYLGTYYLLNKTIISENVSKIYGSDYDYSVQLFNSDGDFLDNVVVNITVNGKTNEYVTDKQGVIVIHFSDLFNSQIISITNPLSGEVAANTITVLPTLIADNLVKYYRNESQFLISLIDVDGNPVSGKNITMNINGAFYNRTTDENGTARLNINLNPGEYVLTAVDPLNGLMMSYNITVLPTLIADNLVKYYRNESQFLISLIDGNGNPVAGRIITMNINGAFYNRTTDENGTARLNINLNHGEYVLTAVDPLNGLMMSYNITVLPTLTAEDMNMTYKDGSVFKVKLIDGKGNPLDNGLITFNINGVFYTRYTNSSGMAGLNINLLPGEYIITSQYGSAIISNKITIHAEDDF